MISTAPRDRLATSKMILAIRRTYQLFGLVSRERLSIRGTSFSPCEGWIHRSPAERSKAALPSGAWPA